MTLSTSVVGLAGTTMNSSIYGSVVFDLTLFNEVTRTEYILQGIRASVIESFIEVIVGLPDIRSHRLIHIIPSYFDTPDPSYLEPPTTSQGQTPTVSRDSATLSLLAPSRKPTQNNKARCRGAAACNNCSPFIAVGYDHTLCSLAGRPHTPQRRDTPSSGRRTSSRKRISWTHLRMMMTLNGNITHSMPTMLANRARHLRSYSPRSLSKDRNIFRPS